MSLLPPSHNDAFARLLTEGHTLFRRGPWVVGVVPFLADDGSLAEGFLVDTIPNGGESFAGPPANHQFYFAGGTPHELDHSVMPLGGNADNTELFDGIKASWLWSYKPPTAPTPPYYEDYYEKFHYYFSAITAPVAHAYPDYDLRPFRNVFSTDDDKSPFLLSDEHAARAGIMDIRDKLLAHVVAVIGAGGTGSYVVDLLSKTPVSRIVIFDPDVMKVHNSFRSPGPIIREDLGRHKVDLLKRRYSRSHKHIDANPIAIDAASADELNEVTFVFVCVDSEKARREIIGILIEKGIPFIDTGMGLNRGRAGLTGMVRTSLCRPESLEKIREEFLNPSHEVVDDEYHTNIQTADLNALNASTAVMMFKKFAGYYDELPMSWQALLTVQSGHTIRYLC